MRLSPEEKQTYRVRAQQLWDTFDKNKQHAVRFGLFPHADMVAVKAEGFDGHEFTLALMDVANKRGGMLA